MLQSQQLLREEHPLDTKKQFIPVVAITNQNVSKQSIQVARNFSKSLSKSIHATSVVFLIKNIHNQNNPHKNSRYLFLKIIADLLGDFTIPNLQFAAHIVDNIILVPLLPLQNEADCLQNRDIKVIPTQEADLKAHPLPRSSFSNMFEERHHISYLIFVTLIQYVYKASHKQILKVQDYLFKKVFEGLKSPLSKPIY